MPSFGLEDAADFSNLTNDTNPGMHLLIQVNLRMFFYVLRKFCLLGIVIVKNSKMYGPFSNISNVFKMVISLLVR